MNIFIYNMAEKESKAYETIYWGSRIVTETVAIEYIETVWKRTKRLPWSFIFTRQSQKIKIFIWNMAEKESKTNDTAW